MPFYVLTMNKCEKVWEGSNEGVNWVFPQFQAIRDTSVAFATNKIIQGCVGKLGRFKRSDAAGTSIFHGSSEDMVLNQALDVLSFITCGGWNF